MNLRKIIERKIDSDVIGPLWNKWTYIVMIIIFILLIILRGILK